MPVGLLARMTRRTSPGSNLSGDETVALFPSLGHLRPEGQVWHVPVHGEVYSHGAVGIGKRILLKLLQRAMKAPSEALQTPVFRSRIARFLARDCKGRTVAVRCDSGHEAAIKRSRNNGHFFGTLQLPVQTVWPDECSRGLAAQVQLQVIRPECGRLLATGRAYLVPAQGLSIISDIDDTLKHTHVGCKQSLLANTFLHEFVPIAGMSELLTRWAAGGAAIHYVSSSPWQLYRNLADHLAAEGFPDGSYHLRAFRLRDHLIRRMLMLRRSGKASVIRGILQTFPERQFILLGDSGEIDPEIYGAMARRFPQQVAGIYIRQMDGPKNTSRRYQRAFRGVRYEVVRLFREAAELAEVLPQ